ncbi:NAD(P)/FAD-dependent oxidoreductase [Bosea sp. NBC_00550]|uniref:NAD(P)/FAD-dependent oxidoreductase n=1 Tax=Bosea sp. NBC_00550 TaxID=2969621 RepID=UPI0022303DF0|nr:FAD-binding oxidoreductase [Bosea sp. NBC_00550]UZF92020.1 FAD-binding oxidoreductase [Bosea sp. NBC_00550]
MSDHHSASEVVIVGGGIYGTSLAYQLAKSGRSVTLLEAGEIAGGASGGPGERGVRANGRDLRELPVCAIAQQLWADYQAKFEGGVGYRRVGGLKIYDVSYGHREHEVRGRMEATAAAQSSLGSPSEVLSRDETLAREPELAPGILGAIWCPHDGVGDHTVATRQFAKEAAKAGAVIRTGAKVAEIVQTRGIATAVKLASGETIPVGSRLVVVANAGAEALLKPVLKPHELGPVWNLMPQMHFVSNPLNKTVNHLLSHAHRRLAVKQLPDGVIMLSGGAHVGYTPEGLWKGSLSSMTQNVTDALHTLPFIDNSSFLSVDASRVETVAVDQIPLIGQAEAVSNLIYGYGWSGHGFAISLGFTKLFADWIKTGEKPEALEPFSPLRFHKPAELLKAAALGRAAA